MPSIMRQVKLPKHLIHSFNINIISWYHELSNKGANCSGSAIIWLSICFNGLIDEIRY
jgi:hypothetical protein